VATNATQQLPQLQELQVQLVGSVGPGPEYADPQVLQHLDLSHLTTVEELWIAAANERLNPGDRLPPNLHSFVWHARYPDSAIAPGGFSVQPLLRLSCLVASVTCRWPPGAPLRQQQS
jgi:hypothetical protein